MGVKKVPSNISHMYGDKLQSAVSGLESILQVGNG